MLYFIKVCTTLFFPNSSHPTLSIGNHAVHTFTVAFNLQAQESRGFYLGLKDRITRNYLDYNKSRILWSHENYEKVGCLTVMTVKVRLHFA